MSPKGVKAPAKPKRAPVKKEHVVVEGTHPKDDVDQHAANLNADYLLAFGIPSWGLLQLSWALLGPSWRPLGPSWAPLGSLLGRLGAVAEQPHMLNMYV